MSETAVFFVTFAALVAVAAAMTWWTTRRRGYVLASNGADPAWSVSLRAGDPGEVLTMTSAGPAWALPEVSSGPWKTQDAYLAGTVKQGLLHFDPVAARPKIMRAEFQREFEVRFDDPVWAARVARLRAYHARRLGRTVEQLERDGVGEGRWSRAVLDAQEEAIAASERAEEEAAQAKAAEDRHARWCRALEVATLLFLGLALSFGMALVLIAFGRIS